MFVRTLGWQTISLSMIAVMTLLLAGAEATVIVDGKGFELPDYDTTFNPPGGTLGQLEGQAGWLRSAGPALSDAVVQTAVVHSGDQAVQVDRAANSDDRWAVPVVGWPSQPYVLIDWEMRVEQTPCQEPECAFGPFFGVEAYDDSGGFGLLGSLGVDATTADILYQDQDTGYFVETGTKVNFGDWNHFQIVLDYSQDQYSVFFNGSLLATTGFVDRSLGLEDFTDADISAIAAAGDLVSQALTGTAYYDSFIVKEVPEPAAAWIALLGLIGLCWVRRNVE